MTAPAQHCSHCPRCSAELSGAPSCASCGLPLSGPLAAELAEVAERIAEVERRVAELQSLRQRLWGDHVRLVVAMSDQAPALPSQPRQEHEFTSPVPAPPLDAWALAALLPTGL